MPFTLHREEMRLRGTEQVRAVSEGSAMGEPLAVALEDSAGWI